MKIFISQPMRGKTTEQIQEERRVLVEQLQAEGHTVLDSVIAKGTPETNHESVWYMGAGLQILAQADQAYFMDGWIEARGCKLEHDICIAYDIPIMHD